MCALVFVLMCWCDMGRALVCLYFFFFQAEDGIRDLVRSRGLGDVYKRQGLAGDPLVEDHRRRRPRGGAAIARPEPPRVHREAVSYTHLTLPTSDLV